MDFETKIFLIKNQIPFKLIALNQYREKAMLQNTNDTNTNAKTESTPSPAKSHSEYVTTIREGAIGAGIFLADRKDGTQGHYFTLSRAYKANGSAGFQIL